MALLANLEPLAAEEILANPSIALTPDGVYHYTLAATGDPAQASRAKVDAALRERLGRFLSGSGEV